MSELNMQERNFQTTVELPLEDYNQIISQNTELKDLIMNIASLYSDPYQETNDLTSAIGVLLSKTSPEKVIGKIGDRAYSVIKSELEQKHWGEYVVIDPDSEEVVAIKSTPVDAMIEAKRIKDKNYFLRKIGVNTSIN